MRCLQYLNSKKISRITLIGIIFITASIPLSGQSTDATMTLYKDIISKNFESKEAYKKEIKKYKNFYDVLNTFYNLKVFNIDIIKKIVTEQNSVDKIYRIKDEKLEKFYEKCKLYQITIQEVNDLLAEYANQLKCFIYGK